jgi:hypothetical protein
MTKKGPVWIRWPYARIRRELEKEHGEILRFVTQLEYDVEATPSGQNEPDWRPVARFDHTKDSELGHDITEEGLHMDVFKNGEKHRVVRNFEHVPLEDAPRFCEQVLEQNADALLERFERWHDLRGPWRI